LSAPLREELRDCDVAGDLLSRLPPGFRTLSPLAQDQHLENRTLLSGYLLSVQGDRMLMGHSVEGRFPFLDPDVMALANDLPDAFKLRGLDEKHVLKVLGRGLIPDEILGRTKQPYRAPDAIAFAGAVLPDWVGERLGRKAVEDAGVFQPDSVAGIVAKLRRPGGEGQFSNSDNMAVVGLLSTQILHQQYIALAPPRTPAVTPGVWVDRATPSGFSSREGRKNGTP
jgi:asparagine synthase (glutamine-hydrolysing)